MVFDFFKNLPHIIIIDISKAIMFVLNIFIRIEKKNRVYFSDFTRVLYGVVCPTH